MKTAFKFKTLVFLVLALSVLFSGLTELFAQAGTGANTTISNFAKGSYKDSAGSGFITVSKTVEIDVRAISSLNVTPNQNTPSQVVAPNETIIREFQVCNTGNEDDSYVITAASVNLPAQITGIFYDADGDGLISAADVQITLNQPLSNIVSQGSCITILIRIDTNDISDSEQLIINLTARSTISGAVNGQAEDNGKIINSGGKAATFTDPNNPTLVPSKLVQKEAKYVSSKNEALEYQIAFRNSGDVDARNVVITDQLPNELSYIADSLKLDGKALTDAADSDEGEISGKSVIVRLKNPVKPNEVVRVTFNATVSGNVIPGTGVINVANVTAENANPVNTTEAIAIIDPFGTVFAARGGASAPIPGATVTILTGGSSGNPLSIPAGQGFDPNLSNTNPYLTDSRGHFSFGLSASQLGTSTQPATYVVSVSAPGFRSRLIQISLSPAGNGLFRMLVSSLDGLPIAVPNGFALTNNGVEISSIADIAFNIPMFEEATLEINKTVDRIQAELGDVANYRIEFGNSSVAPILNVIVTDTLPQSFSYVEGTARIMRGGETTPIKPLIKGNILEFMVGDMASGERISIQYRVRIGVNARKGDNYNSAVVSGTFSSGEFAESAVSRALVKVSPGMFSMRQFIIGRIYVDDNKNSVFDDGEKPVAGARVYLSNGNSATTDSQGLYSIPAVSSGAQVIALDPITIPKGFVLADSRRRSGKDWTRLLRTPLGGGGMLRQNFVLVSDGSDPKDDNNIVKTKADNSTNILRTDTADTIEDTVAPIRTEKAPKPLRPIKAKKRKANAASVPTSPIKAKPAATDKPSVSAKPAESVAIPDALVTINTSELPEKVKPPKKVPPPIAADPTKEETLKNSEKSGKTEKRDKKQERPDKDATPIVAEPVKTDKSSDGVVSVKTDNAQEKVNSAKTEPTPIVARPIKTEKRPITAKRIDKKPKTEKSRDTNIYRRVAPGGILVHKLSDGKVVMTPALNIDVSVAQDWQVQLELNGVKISDKNIGATRKDPRNQITSYSFVGLGLKPGPNKLRATSVSPTGQSGKSLELEIYGRGPVKRLEIFADRNELQASGRDSTAIIIKAYDEWENPAQDSSVSIQTSSGRFADAAARNSKGESGKKSVANAEILRSNGQTSEQVNNTLQQQKVNLVGGIGFVKLVSDNKPGTAKITTVHGKAEASTDIRFTSEIRPSLLVGLAEVTVGKNAPEMINRGVDESIRGHIQFFYKGSVFGKKNRITLAYDSQEPLNRISGQDRLFQLNPLDHVYPIFGDSSTRFQETESNSKVYARFDRGRSYAMFGDFDSGLETSRLLAYSRRLTGGKIHIENRKGDFITVTGARPDTAFARQVIPGGSLGLVQLAFGETLPGSEVLTIETRDRRNPELIISREILSRSVDYNIDTTTGTIFFLRQIPTFDRDLNLVQVVATYEYRSTGFESSVYTARASKNFQKLGLRLGFSYINQKQTEASPFQLGGIDATLKLPNQGKLEFEWAKSHGSLNGGFGFFGNNPSESIEFNGNAFFLTVDQPLSGMQTTLKFQGFSASRNFYNPFGATVTPGTTRGAVTIESKPVKNGTLQVNLVGERNSTENVDNNRITAGVKYAHVVGEKLRFNVGYDFRRFSDSKTDKSIVSNLLTAGVDFNPTSKLDFSIKREQNLGDEDPSYPNQTIIAANYRFNQFAKLFFTQRLASNPITPISDISGTGFASSKARYETAIGVETRFGKYTSMSGRYQLESGINGTDSFSIIGLQNRIPINKEVALEVGFERAFHIAGDGESYNNFTLGANWLPDENFRTSFRYELRDRNGFGQLFSLGAAGRFKPGWTTLGRFQYGDIDFNGRKNLVMNGQLALAIRPHNTDKYGFLLSYKHRESFFSNGKEDTPNELREDTFSVDGFHQTTRRLELYGKFAAKFTADRTPNVPFANNLTLLTQARAQYRLTRWFDVAAEGRYLYQPTSGSKNRWLGIEAGYWATPDIRIGGGYNFSKSKDAYGFNNNEVFKRGGFYFTISTKLSRLFDLFGTPKKGLKHYEDKNSSLRRKKVARKRKD